MAATEEELLHVEGVGDQVAGSIREYLPEPPQPGNPVAETAGAGVQGLAPEAPAASPLAGKTFVFTGGLARLLPGGGQGPGRGPGRQGEFLGLRQDRLRGGRGRPGEQVWPRPGSWG